MQSVLDQLLEDPEPALTTPEARPKAFVLACQLVEDDADDDFSDIRPKDFQEDDPLVLAASDLRAAGFTVITARRDEDEIYLTAAFPYTDINSCVSGARRAREIIQAYFYMSPESLVVTRNKKVKTAHLVFRKYYEPDPKLWQIEYSYPRRHCPNAFFTFKFGGTAVGEAYCPGGQDLADRIREEMAVLHQIVPFQPPNHISYVSGKWVSGPALEWWQKNRDRLPDKLRRRNNNFLARGQTNPELNS